MYNPKTKHSNGQKMEKFFWVKDTKQLFVEFIIVGQIFLFLVFEFSTFLIMYQRKL